ncbi:hypothetical protein Amir_3469 [Actinosynnema mirum DSM 43827]|uniref:Uncharacterized protein n=2 Tax=Actinosynnema mirum TaxID=40567 RepID=C6WAP4_ACTMD|nr:hypothetical protein Amir_3469 [Actinosynnema mirum DSM 43827]
MMIMHARSAAESSKSRRDTAAGRGAAGTPPSAFRAPPDRPLPATALPALQRGLGNAAVVAMLAEQTAIQRSARPERDVQRADVDMDDADMDAITAAYLQDRRNAFIRALRTEFGDNGWSWSGSAPNGEESFRATAPTKQSKPKDFSGEPEVQALRWVSSVVKSYLDMGDPKESQHWPLNPVEVQSAIGGDGTLIIAANDQSSNARLQSLAGRASSGKALLDTFLERNATRGTSLAKPSEHREEIEKRLHRHHENLKELLSKEPASHSAVMEALKRKITVASNGDAALHAERRIAERNQGTPQFIAGTKRPCVSCFMANYPNGSELHPGIFHSGPASNVDIDEYRNGMNNNSDEEAREWAKRLFQRMVDAGVTSTYQTLVWHCGRKVYVPVPEVGTDSETGG